MLPCYCRISAGVWVFLIVWGKNDLILRIVMHVRSKIYSEQLYTHWLWLCLKEMCQEKMTLYANVK